MKKMTIFTIVMLSISALAVCVTLAPPGAELEGGGSDHILVGNCRK